MVLAGHSSHHWRRLHIAARGFWAACCAGAADTMLCAAMSEQAFLGEVATWTGIVTGTLMFASPALFARWKWRGVAGATPAFMLWTGLPFFVGCALYNVVHPGQSLVGAAALRALVIVGAILQVKFTLFVAGCWISFDHSAAPVSGPRSDVPPVLQPCFHAAGAWGFLLPGTECRATCAGGKFHALASPVHCRQGFSLDS